MRQDVRHYGMQRVEKLEAARLDALRKKYTVEGTTATPQQLGAALKAGKLPFKKDVCLTGIDRHYSSLKDVFDLAAFDVADKFDEKAYNLAAKPIIKAANKAKDFIMLGKDEPALAAIREFEADA